MEMRFGVREIADVTFRPLTATDIGSQHFEQMQPCLYIDSATTSSLEAASTTVYAQGGKGNSRLIAWEGEKTVTFTVTDALMSPMSFAMLSGAGVVNYDGNTSKAVVHKVIDAVLDANASVNISALLDGETLANQSDYPTYGTLMEDGRISDYLGKDEISANASTGIVAINGANNAALSGKAIRIDCYVNATHAAQEIEIDAENFAGYYYIEADTLFRDEATGKDFPASFVIPKGKIQSNFTFTMAASGDPSTFDFTIDAFPAYTRMNKKKKTLFTLQVVDTVTKDTHATTDTSVDDHGSTTVSTKFPTSA